MPQNRMFLKILLVFANRSIFKNISHVTLARKVVRKQSKEKGLFFRQQKVLWIGYNLVFLNVLSWKCIKNTVLYFQGAKTDPQTTHLANLPLPENRPFFFVLFPVPGPPFQRASCGSFFYHPPPPPQNDKKKSKERF